MKKEKNVKKAFLWNMIGSTCYSGSSFLYLLVVTRICGATLAGFFSLSYATAQLLLQIGRYGVRTYQATDLNRKYSFSEYKLSAFIHLRHILCPPKHSKTLSLKQILYQKCLKFFNNNATFKPD